jgi:hypothetical protein
MTKRILAALLLAFGIVFAVASAAVAQQTPSTPGAKVFFVNIKDGDSVSNPVTIKFGLTGMTVAKAGTFESGTGHHHLLIDSELADLTSVILADDEHRHFGGGQTEVTLTLPHGKHTLQLILGDGNHIPHNPPVMSEVITVTVN